MFGGSKTFVPILLYGLSVKNSYKGKSVLILQGTREEGYADPAMAAQDAMVTRTSSQNDCRERLLNWPRMVMVLPPACMMFQVLWEACQQKTGEHKTMLQMILCNKSYQQLWLGNYSSGFFSDT